MIGQTGSSEAGFTLVELLVAMTVLLVVMLATLAILDESTRLAKRDGERSHAIREAQVGLDRMIRELRHGRLVHEAGPDVLDVTVAQRGVDRRVVFDCRVPHPTTAATRRCTRTAGGATDVLVDRVRDAVPARATFGYSPAVGTARHVTVSLTLALDGGRRDGARRDLVLSDGSTMRNVP